MIYKLFRALVDYDADYKSIEEVILDSDQYEATALVTLQTTPGNFHRNPYWIDSFGHLSGFVMNASDATDSRNEVFVNHGWDSMRCLKKFSSGITYRTYVRMQPWQNSIWAGDVYIFDGEGIVAVFGGVKVGHLAFRLFIFTNIYDQFQKLARKILDTVLPPGSASKPSKPTRPASLLTNEQKAFAVAKEEALPDFPACTTAPSVMSRVLKILAEEVGLDESEMADNLVFADYGVDSLLSLTVTGRFREELGLDLESSVFIDYPTIMDLKALLTQSASSYSSRSSRARESSFSSIGTSTDISSVGSLGSLPVPIREHSKRAVDMKEVGLVITEEIGISLNDIGRDESLGDLGMDSLLSLTVLGRIRETLDKDLPSDFFLENQTLNDIETALNLKPNIATEPDKDPGPSPRTKPKEIQHPPATSILLQGNPKTASRTLFLFPDGSGSATSYATIPNISPDICVYGLNCPYMKTPENLTCSLDQLTAPYLTEIHRRQQKGPYNFGGWSAGGISAYDAAKALLDQNEQVDRLLLLDTPFPAGLEKLPSRLYDFFNAVGLFSDGRTKAAASPPKWLLPHFLAFIDSLDVYKASPLPFPSSKIKIPRTFLLWAKNGVCGPSDPRPPPASDGSKDPKEMTWLLNDRTDLGPNGWDGLVGRENIAGIAVLEGANHFSMMRREKGREVASVLGRWMMS